MKRHVIAMVGAAALASASVNVEAANFTANIINVSPPGAPNGRCAPAITVRIGDSVGSATGTSNFGAFEPEHSSCTAGPPPTAVYDGLFEWTFVAGDTLRGTFSGQLAPTVTPGVLRLTNSWTVTGGTGIFEGVTGSLSSVGMVRFERGNSIGDIHFTGTLNGVPEPAAWALMIIGFGAAGTALRRAQNVIAAA